MKALILIPSFISSLRLAALPIFYYLYSTENTVACLALMAFSVATDFLDGYLARKLNVCCKFGAYFDATTDFTLVIGILALFTFEGFYPVWLVFVIAASFIQFIVTSFFAKKLYDPIGKYLGSALYIGVVLTLLFPVEAIFNFVQYAFAGFFLVSLGSRIWSLTKKNA